MKRVLVTGGCGFIGSNLVPLLKREHYEVRILDNLIRGSLELVKGTDVEIINGDIRDTGILEQAVANVDAVVHLAAYGSVVESVDDPLTNFDINARGTLLLLEAARKANVKKFLFASTGGALIGDATPPVNEDSTPRPKSPYGASKLAGEAYCYSCRGSYDMEIAVLRFGNIYGPQSLHKKGAITNFIKAVLLDQPITIYGDGTSSRDFLYVEDLCNGIINALGKELQGESTFHLSYGYEKTIYEVAKLISQIAQKPNHPIKFAEKRRGEVYRNFANYNLAYKVLGFKPYVDLETGLGVTFEWFRKCDRKSLETKVFDS